MNNLNLGQDFDGWVAGNNAGQAAQPPAQSDAGPDAGPVPQPAAEDPTQAFYRVLAALGQHAEQLSNNQAQMGSALLAMTQRVEALTFASANPAPVNVTVSSPNSGGGSGSNVKTRAPRMFAGKSDHVLPFLRELRATFELQNVTDSYRRVLMLSMYLEDGSVLYWYNNVERNHPDLLRDWPRFEDAFKKRFEDANQVNKAYRELQKLRQTGSAANYASRFKELLAFVDVSEFMQIAMFDQGLKPSVKQALVTVTRPDKLEAWTKIVIDADNKIHDLDVETRELNKKAVAKSSNPKPQSSSSLPPASFSPAPVPAAAITSSNNDVVPMEIDAVRRGPLTPAEKEHRRKNGLCFYCGKGKHTISECPNMSEKAKKKAKATPSWGKA